MKLSNNLLLYSFSLLLFLGLSSCIKDTCEREVTYLQSTPVFMTKDEIRQGTPVTEAARALEHPGQFYYYNQYILIAEKGEGIHIIDNHDPRSPQAVAFLSIPGAENMSVKDNILYVNNFIDLLAIDITDIQQASLIGRTPDVFQPIWEDINSGQVLVRYDIEEVTEKMACASYSNLRSWNGILVDNATFSTFEADATASGGIGTGGVGIGGSLARFTIIGDYLYTVGHSQLDVISLLQPRQPQRVNTINLGWGIETIFPYQDKLFIGSNSGMFIFDNSNPAAPTQLSAFAHARACDPVFVKDNYAYVTLRDGNTCDGFVNQMDLVDITDLTNPKLEKSFPMDNPHGLTIRGNSLILCEGTHGLKAFDISDPLTLDQHLLDTYTDVHAVDAISLPGNAPITVVIGKEGFYQFQLNPTTGFELLSLIPVK
ncbi:MAG: hypothetical protein DA408_14615 [Bacteroidetes bacterium]|nr:MAG: hypothetical protein C7N36_15380 [Bacteroidota bacterium]PTM11024.1 MAG: hypothetical protein DA408_14615 [Bacteroidota bacterium]